VFNIPEEFLLAMLASVLAQTYDNWELCIANASPENQGLSDILHEHAKRDCRIKIIPLEKNLGISGNTNALLSTAKGQYVGFLDHDDTLAPFALYEVVQVLNQNPDFGLIYSDHDILDKKDGKRISPLFKPDWSPDIMLSANYITHFTVIKRELVLEAGGFRSEFDGAQDWDLFLRIVEKEIEVGHIAKILYHWRDSSTSTATDIKVKPYASEAQLKAIKEHLMRTGRKFPEAFLHKSGFIKVKWEFQEKGKVSILIPTRGAGPLLENCIQSIVNLTEYPDYEVIIINNGENTPEAFPYFQDLKSSDRIRVIHYQGTFNYSAVNNYGVENSSSDYILFLNNDTEVLEGDWLDEMVMWASLPTIGAVGAKLIRPNGKIQHAGVVLGLTGFAGHIFGDQDEGVWSIFGLPEWYRNYMAITAACMIMRRNVYEQVGGFSEEFILCGNDVELGIRLNEAGYRIIYVPFVRLRHMEAATRENQVPDHDFIVSYNKTQHLLKTGDPYFNPNLSYWSLQPRLHQPVEETPNEFALKYKMSIERKLL